MSLFQYKIFAVLIISVYAGTEDAGQGSWQARTYNGVIPDRQYVNANLSYYYPFDSLYNIYTYASYLQQYISQLQKNIQQIIEAQKQAAAGLVKPGASKPVAGGVNGAIAGGFIGPNGGYGMAGLLPFPTNIQGGAIPPMPATPGGAPSYHGIFSSASSSSSDVNGQHKEEHSSVFGVDNNGQVTVYTAHNP